MIWVTQFIGCIIIISDILHTYGTRTGIQPRAENDVSFATYYEDHMVLQRSPYKAVIWGYTSDITNAVTLTVGTEKYECDTSIGPTGKPIWNATIDPMTEFGPFDITVSTDTSNATIRDVLFGDVWLCSGQSNMQFTIRQAGNPIVDTILTITEPRKYKQDKLVRFDIQSLRLLTPVFWL